MDSVSLEFLSRFRFHGDLLLYEAEISSEFAPIQSAISFWCNSFLFSLQLIAAFFISSIYSLVMMAVMVGIVIQMMDDGILSPSSLFFLAVSGQVIITGLLHPQELGALICGIVYYITIPSMYMLLQIYSMFNMNDVSWGTRETAPAPSSLPTPPNTIVSGWIQLSVFVHLLTQSMALYSIYRPMPGLSPEFRNWWRISRQRTVTKKKVPLIFLWEAYCVACSALGQSQTLMMYCSHNYRANSKCWTKKSVCCMRMSIVHIPSGPELVSSFNLFLSEQKTK